MKMYDVIVGRHNGAYLATVPTLPNLSAEGTTRDEAVSNVKKAIEEFFKSAEVMTVAIEVPASEFPLANQWLHQAELRRNPQDPNLDRRSPRVWLETAGMFVGDEQAMWQHIEEIEAERGRQREEVEREYDLLEAKSNGE